MSGPDKPSWQIAALAGVVLVVAAVVSTHPSGTNVNRSNTDSQLPAATSPDPLDRLRAGNTRYVESHRVLSTDTLHDAELRKELAGGQHPFTAILCCADSRVCPEFIFDQAPGSFFEIRNAGNVVDDDVMGSLEYAVEHLHVPMILILAHNGCGAIAAVHEAAGRPLHDHLRALQEHMAGIQEEVQRTRAQHSAAVLDALSEENARQQALTLLHDSEPLRNAVDHGETRLMFGLYDISTGRVELKQISKR